jgi:hypothetical protein
VFVRIRMRDNPDGSALATHCINNYACIAILRRKLRSSVLLIAQIQKIRNKKFALKMVNTYQIDRFLSSKK